MLTAETQNIAQLGGLELHWPCQLEPFQEKTGRMLGRPDSEMPSEQETVIHRQVLQKELLLGVNSD